jgi:hypothetical protein
MNNLSRAFIAYNWRSNIEVGIAVYNRERSLKSVCIILYTNSFPFPPRTQLVSAAKSDRLMLLKGIIAAVRKRKLSP